MPGVDRVAGDLDRPGHAYRRDDQLVAVEACPDPGVDQLVRHRVTHALDGERGVQYTRQVVPKATVNALTGKGCSRARVALAL
jgi:hypothetical protein